MLSQYAIRKYICDKFGVGQIIHCGNSKLLMIIKTDFLVYQIRKSDFLLWPNMLVMPCLSDPMFHVLCSVLNSLSSYVALQKCCRM